MPHENRRISDRAGGKNKEKLDNNRKIISTHCVRWGAALGACQIKETNKMTEKQAENPQSTHSEGESEREEHELS